MFPKSTRCHSGGCLCLDTHNGNIGALHLCLRATANFETEDRLSGRPTVSNACTLTNEENARPAATRKQ